jgi:hypothetical protein
MRLKKSQDKNKISAVHINTHFSNTYRSFTTICLVKLFNLVLTRIITYFLLRRLKNSAKDVCIMECQRDISSRTHRLDGSHAASYRAETFRAAFEVGD